MYKLVTIKCIVEGYGETEAVPELLKRIARRHFPDVIVRCPNPIRQTRSKLLREGELERCVILASRQLTLPGAILILVDSDDDCPATLGPAIVARARHTAAHRQISASLAHREFESWFLAAAPSLSTLPGFSKTIEWIPDSERIRGAKERITNLMTGDRVYKETVDQKTLARVFDLDMAKGSHSFSRFYQEVIQMIDQLLSSEA